MPEALPREERSDEQWLELYHDLADSAWEDGNLDPVETRVPDTARAKLGVSTEDALRIEREMAS